jgi:membrane protein implicated in regulation of membrane protease activity
MKRIGGIVMVATGVLAVIIGWIILYGFAFQIGGSVIGGIIVMALLVWGRSVCQNETRRTLFQRANNLDC